MSRSLYIISNKIKTNKLEIKECVITASKGLITLNCKDSDPTLAVLSLIERGVPATAVSAWTCGPQGKLAEIYRTNPNPCHGTASYATIVCDQPSYCIKIIEYLKENLKYAKMKKNKQQSCCFLKIKFKINFPVIKLAEIIEATNGECIMLKPLKIPPLPIIRGEKLWKTGFFQLKAPTSSKTQR